MKTSQKNLHFILTNSRAANLTLSSNIPLDLIAYHGKPFDYIIKTANDIKTPQLLPFISATLTLRIFSAFEKVCFQNGPMHLNLEFISFLFFRQKVASF